MDRNVVRFALAADDLAATRFSVSATHELVRALAVLQDPSRHPLQWGWLRRVQGSVPAPALELLRLVAPPTGYVADFLTPIPGEPLAPGDELELVRHARPALVRRDLEKCRVRAQGRRRAALERLLERPARARDALADALGEAWEALLQPWWPSLERVLRADIAQRSRTLAADGFGVMAQGLHERVAYADGTLTVRLQAWGGDVPASGRGLLLVPSVFLWPGCSVLTDDVAHPVLLYPAAGVRETWPEGAADDPARLAAVVGEGRARLLLALEEPRSTSSAAAAAGLAVSTASEQLALLREAGWVHSRRDGRAVVHELTATGVVVTAGAR